MMTHKNIIIGILSVPLMVACSQFGRISPTPVIAPNPADQPQVQPETVIPSPAPFQFNLPRPGVESVSGWRPPLYPVPWAMSPYDHFYFARPIAADQINWPVPDYRYGGIFFAPNIVHTGIDIPAPEGTPILAAGPGTIVWVGWGLFTETPGNQSDPYGIAVAIRHDFGYNDQQLYTIYAHMSESIAVVGQHVETGEPIGLVGATGATTGPHVHFEVRYPINSFDHTYNPELWIAPPQGWGVLVGRLTDTKSKNLEQIIVNLKSEETEKTYQVKTYGGGGAINVDPYYKENMVLGDLPAGIYKVSLSFDTKIKQTWIEIFAGQVSYFTFKCDYGFSTERPPAQKPGFLPAILPFTPTPLP